MSINVQIHLDHEAIRPLVREIALEVLAQAEADRQQVAGKLAFGEAEAARMLSLAQHQIRDERARGRIGASVGPGRRILYTTADLQHYLASRRWKPTS